MSSPAGCSSGEQWTYFGHDGEAANAPESKRQQASRFLVNYRYLSRAEKSESGRNTQIEQFSLVNHQHPLAHIVFGIDDL